MRTLIHILLSAIAVFVSAKILPGVTVEGFAPALVAAIVLGFLNTLVRPFLIILTLPINVLTLGLFTFVIMGCMVELAAAIVPGFSLRNFWWAMAFSIVLALINSFVHALEWREPPL